MKKTILLLDDDSSVYSFVKDCLEELLLNIYYTKTVEEAKHILNTKNVHAAILDVHLSYTETGTSVAEYILKNQKIPFLFLTGHSDDMITGILKKYNAYCQLIKPVNPRQLFLEVKSMLSNESRRVISTPTQDQFLTIRVKGDRVVIRKADIIYVEAEGNYSRVVTYEAKYTVAKTLKVLGQWLTEDKFVRTSRSYIVNIESVRKVSIDKVHLTNGHVIPISRNQYKVVMNHFINL